MLREIACKTLIGRGKCVYSIDKTIFINDFVSKTLGCWIINLNYETFMDKKDVYIKGNYDLQIWYASNENQKSEVYVERIEFEEKINIGYRNIKTLNDEYLPKVYVSKYPTCSTMDLQEDKKISLSVDALFYIDIFSEAIIVVDCKEDYVEDLSLEEEIALNVDPRKIEEKK